MSEEYGLKFVVNGEDYDKIKKSLNEQIEDLQQKVEQLEKENIKQKEIIENLTTMTVCGDKKQIKNTAQYKLEQLENIRKEAIEYINHEIFKRTILVGVGTKKYTRNILDNILNILNKGDNNGK